MYLKNVEPYTGDVSQSKFRKRKFLELKEQGI